VIEDDLSEVQTYYSMLLQDKINDIEQLLPQIDEQDRAALLHDIETMQQEADAMIQDSDDKYIDLIVTTYSSKIESLQHIQNILLTNY
jgi:uridine kinase